MMTATNNDTVFDDNSFKFDENNKTVEIVELVYHTVAIAFGVPANLWAAFRYYRIWSDNPAKKRLVWLGANMTLANLMILLIHSPNQIQWLLTVDWRMGEAACKVLLFLRVLAHHFSSNSTVIIAVDMYSSFHRPLHRRSKTTTRSAMVAIATGALVAVLCASPQLFTWGLVEIPGTNGEKAQCLFLYFNDITVTVTYQLFHLVAIFYAPLLIIIMCYCRSGLYLWSYLKKRKTLAPQYSISMKDYGDKVAMVTARRSIVSNSSFTSKNNNGRIKRKMLKVSACVVLLYIFSWLPYQTVSLVNTGYMLTLPADREVILSEPWWYDYVIWLEALQICNACLNPIVYCFHGL